MGIDHLKRCALKLIRACGYDILGYKVVDARNMTFDTLHPLEFVYTLPKNHQACIHVPLSRLRSFGGRKIERNYNPFVDVTFEYIGKGKQVYVHGSSLERFAKLNKTSNAAEALGVPMEMAPGFANMPNYAAVYPWELVQNSDALRIATLKKELGKYSKDNMRQICADQNLRMEAEILRIIRIYCSIKKFGFTENKKDYHPLVGQLLLGENNEWIILVRQGEHRVAALQACGESHVPILISADSVVRLSECAYWPQVTNMNITKFGALNVFNRIMLGENNAPLVNVAGYFI